MAVVSSRLYGFWLYGGQACASALEKTAWEKETSGRRRTMNIRMRAAAIAVTAAGALGLGMLGVGPALAGTGTVTAVTHTMNHPDTTSVSSSCTNIGFPGGPVWAYDNLSLRLVATQTGTDTYAVTIYAHGSFSAVCNPVTGSPMTGQGSVDGWYDLTVTSPTPPDPAAVPPQQESMTSQGAMVQQLFPDATNIAGGHYGYTYNRINGGKYQQNG